MCNCKNLTKVIANNVKAISIAYCFRNCPNLTEINGLNTWNTNGLTNTTYAFEKTSLTSLDDMANWNTENVTNMSYMFQNTPITNIDFMLNWNMGKVTNMSNMFSGCSSLTSANLSSWDTSGVTNMTNMFLNCSSLTTFISMPISVSISFSGCNNLTVDSLMSIVNNLATVTTTQTLTIGSKNIAKLTADQIAIAINKGWTVV